MMASIAVRAAALSLLYWLLMVYNTLSLSNFALGLKLFLISFSLVPFLNLEPLYQFGRELCTHLGKKVFFFFGAKFGIEVLY
jgi:hypothetical protein